MKRFLLSVCLCISLLGLLSLVLVRSSRAKEDVIQSLLDLPAPPPPNPLSPPVASNRNEKFYDKKNPPPDDAAIDDLLDYWKHYSSRGDRFGYSPTPSERVVQRIAAEIERNPKLIGDYINILGDSRNGIDLAKRIYDGMSESDPDDADDEDQESEGEYGRGSLREWLTNNSPYFSEDLARSAGQLHDTDGYVTNHRELVSLARVDWERARAIVDRAYSDATQPIGQTAAKWALYKHALQDDSIGDIDRYRQELMDVVANKNLPAGHRDLALDALLTEKEWSGRDDWYFSLFNDETLLDLGTYTGLTTMMLWAPDDRYVARMIELLNSDNVNVRTAAARNLTLEMSNDKPEIVQALLPWLRDPKWAKDVQGSRLKVVQALQTVKLADSVPGLIMTLDENEKSTVPDYGEATANAVANAANVAANSAYYGRYSANANTNAAVTYTGKTKEVTVYPLRSAAINALGNQEDARAVQPLKRVFNQVEAYEKLSVVSALLKCNGFTVAEQLKSLEGYVRNAAAERRALEGSEEAPPGSPYSNVNAVASNMVGGPAIPGFRTDLGYLLGSAVAASKEVSEELAAASIRRVGELEKTDEETAEAMRTIITKWRGKAVNLFLLNDVRTGKTSATAIVRLLGVRKELRETQPADISGIRTGTAAAFGISACLLESQSDYAVIMEGKSDEAKKALFACARLIRAKLPLKEAAKNLHSPDKQLVLATERYLESEDSPEARKIVLSQHPGEAKILGATMAFRGGERSESYVDEDSVLMDLFASVAPEVPSGSLYYIPYASTQFDDAEKKLQKEILASTDLIGIYAYDNSFVRVYKEKAVFSREEDESRYRERTLEKEEFEALEKYLVRNRADELGPFLACPNDCLAKEFVTLTKVGGRRVYVSSARKPDFFVGLEEILDQMAARPGKLVYWLAKDLPGVEIVFASDRYMAETVWKKGPDLRVLVADSVREREIVREIRKKVRETESAGDVDPTWAETEKRKLEHYSWRRIPNGEIGEIAPQPPEVSYIPTKDELDPAAVQDGWRARAANFELRASTEGLYKVTAGRSVKIAEGYFANPVVSANGRWAIATRYEPDDGPQKLIRINLLTNRLTPIAEEETNMTPIAYVAAVNRFLVGYRSADTEYEDVQTRNDDGRGTYYWITPETGRVDPILSGELGPIGQQRYRPLQPTAVPFEFWAAIPERETGATTFGIYNTRSFTMRPLLNLPRIQFNSQAMWVDDAASRLYFVYEGHVLSVPFKR